MNNPKSEIKNPGRGTRLSILRSRLLRRTGAETTARRALALSCADKDKAQGTFISFAFGVIRAYARHLA